MLSQQTEHRVVSVGHVHETCKNGRTNLLGRQTQLGSENHLLDGVKILPWERAILGVVLPILDHRKNGKTPSTVLPTPYPYHRQPY